MKFRIGIGLILLVSVLAGCGKSSTTSPSDLTINVPAAGTFSVSNANNSVYCFQDALVTVTDENDTPRQGVKLTIYEHGAFGGFYTDYTFATLRSSPYEDETDSYGKIKVNYCTAPFTCSATADFTATLGYRVQSGTISATHTDTYTIKKCGT